MQLETKTRLRQLVNRSTDKSSSPQMLIHKVCNTGHDGPSLSLSLSPLHSPPPPLNTSLFRCVSINSHFDVLISFGRLMVTSEMVNTVVAELEVFQSTIQSNMHSYCVHVHGHTCTLLARPLHTLVVAHELGKHIVFQLHKS